MVINTLSLHSALCNIAQNILYAHSLLKTSWFQPQRINRGRTWMGAGQRDCLRYFANSYWVKLDLWRVHCTHLYRPGKGAAEDHSWQSQFRGRNSKDICHYGSCQVLRLMVGEGLLAACSFICTAWCSVCNYSFLPLFFPSVWVLKTWRYVVRVYRVTVCPQRIMSIDTFIVMEMRWDSV